MSIESTKICKNCKSVIYYIDYTPIKIVSYEKPACEDCLKIYKQMMEKDNVK